MINIDKYVHLYMSLGGFEMAVTTGKVRGHGQGITAAQVNLDPTTGCQSRYARTVTFKVMPLN